MLIHHNLRPPSLASLQPAALTYTGAGPEPEFSCGSDDNESSNSSSEDGHLNKHVLDQVGRLRATIIITSITMMLLWKFVTYHLTGLPSFELSNDPVLNGFTYLGIAVQV